MTGYTPCFPKHAWDIVKDDVAAFEKDRRGSASERASASGAGVAGVIEARRKGRE